MIILLNPMTWEASKSFSLEHISMGLVGLGAHIVLACHNVCVFCNGM